MAAGAPALSMIGVAKSFAAGIPGCLGRVSVLRSVSLEVHAGETVVLTGGAGAGKTTTLLCAAGLLRADAGLILWNGVPSASLGQRSTAFVPSVPVFRGYLPVGDVLALAERAGEKPSQRVRSVLRRLGLSRHLQVRVSQLDSVLLRRLALACAVQHQPQLLLLDDAPAGSPHDAVLLAVAIEIAGRRGATVVAARSAAQLRHLAMREDFLRDGVIESCVPVSRAPATPRKQRGREVRGSMVAEAESLDVQGVLPSYSVGGARPASGRCSASPPSIP